MPRLDLGHPIPLGRSRRLELSVGGIVGLAREALHLRAGQTPPPCGYKPPAAWSPRAQGAWSVDASGSLC